MKAKELVAKHPFNDDREHLVSIVAELVEETCKLLEVRHIKNTKGCLGAFQEQQQKWYAVLNLLKEDDRYKPLFRTAIEEAIPEWKVLLEMAIQGK